MNEDISEQALIAELLSVYSKPQSGEGSRAIDIASRMGWGIDRTRKMLNEVSRGCAEEKIKAVFHSEWRKTPDITGRPTFVPFYWLTPKLV